MTSTPRIHNKEGGDRVRKLAIIMLAALLIALAAMAVLSSGVAYAGKGTTTTVAINTIKGYPSKGMYCADPAGWISGGYNIYVWGNATPVKAQVYDFEGYLQTPAVSWLIPSTGETGSMTILDATNKVFTATPKSLSAVALFNDTNREIQYTANGKTVSSIIRRWNSKCDGCHSTPPAHAQANAGSAGTSTCRNTACHADYGFKQMQSHATRVPNNTSATACVSCHPPGCYTGLHSNFNVDCVSCHGSLADLASGAGMYVTGSKGLPRCENCHTTPDSSYVVPYAQNAGKQYKESVGHGRKRVGQPKNLCISCHKSMHMEVKPTNLGDGVNNNCETCHVNKPTANNMGDQCGNCHVDSFNPHRVQK